MIQSLTIAEQLIAVTVSGTVNKDDWEKVADAVHHALQHHENVCVYADLTHLDSITGGAVYEDAKVGIQNLGNLDQFNRVAVVTDKDWVQRTVEFSQKLLPGVEVTVFPSADSDEAHQWAITG